jgi:hypothetical protein
MPSRQLPLVGWVLVCVLAGCNPEGKLIGQWEADFSGIKSEAAEAGNPLAAMAATMMSSVKLQSQFNADGTCSVTGSFFGTANTTNGKWRYVRSEGDTLVLMVAMSGGDSERELRVKFIDHDTFEMASPVEATGQSDRMLAFRRTKT